MKKIIATFFLLLSTFCAYGQPGCMSKSQNLKQKYDSKAWHYVACNCDCKKNAPKGLYAQKQNKCLECGHRHEPQPLIFMKQTVAHNQKTSSFPPSARGVVQSAINRYRSSKSKIN